MSDPNNPVAYPPPPADGGAYSPMAPVGPQYAQPMGPVGPAPKPVANAAMLMLVSAALGLIGVIVLYASKSSLRTAILKKNPSYDPTKLNTAVNAALVVATVFAVIFIVLYVWLSRQLLKGKNWARIVTWIITALGVLSALTSLANPTAALTRVFDLIAGVIDIAIIVLLLQKPSNAFFRRVR
ncbi:MAG: hypothetical protein ACRDV3_06715 [Acidothermaceae bacterium]